MKNLLLPALFVSALFVSALFVSALFVSCTTDENEYVIKTNPGTNAGITTSSVYSKVYPEASNRNNPYDAAGKLFIDISNAVIAANPKHTVSAIFSLTLAANAQKTTINDDLSKGTDTHGQCTANKGICINTGGTGPTYPTESTISVFVSSGVATLSFNDAYFKENSKYLAKGYIEVSNDFAIPEKVASTLGLTDTYYVKAGNLAFTKDSSGQYLCPLPRLKYR